MQHTDKRLLPILALCALGVALLLLGGRAETLTVPTAAHLSETETLEARIAALCREVAGVGEVRVAVTLAETDGVPRPCGIGVVCTGGHDPAVVERLVALLSAAFDLGANRICVTPSA